MTSAEQAELALIPIIGAGVWLTSAQLPKSVGAGMLLLGVSALLLLQSLVRDLWLLAKHRRQVSSAPRREATCMCVESTVGATGVAVGALLLGAGIGRPVEMGGWSWSLLAVGVMAVGFIIKDLVLEWRPFRVRRDRDHMNIVFTWKG